MSGSRSAAVPGLAVALVLAIAAYELHDVPVPPFSIGEPARHPIDAMLISIVLGMLVRNTIGLPARCAPGVRVCVTKLMALNEQDLDFAPVLEMARSVREQIDFDAVRERTADSSYARAFFTLVEGLNVIEQS